jgi:CSLREA domain-containing protein
MFALLLATAAFPLHAEVQINYVGPPVAIPDAQPDGVNVGVTVAGLRAIVDLDVRFAGTPPCSGSTSNITAAVTHPVVGNLVVRLTSPQGTTITLINQRGGLRDNLCELTIDDSAPTPVSSASSVDGQPFNGRFAPEQPLSVFNGEDPSGVWTINVSDRAAGGTGTLRAVSLVLDTLPIDISPDSFDDPTPGTCTPGSCSLREAVQLANAQLGPNRILLQAGAYDLSRGGADEDGNGTGDLDITDDLIIVGTGAATTILSQSAADRALHAQGDGVDLTLRDLTVSGGSGVDDGGGVYMADGRIEIERVTLVGNRARHHGGALYSGAGAGPGDERIILRSCRFDGNQATNATASDAFGGAVYSISAGGSAVFLRVEDCTFVDNQADNGGGALALDGVQSVSNNRGTITGSTFSRNAVTVAGRGGAIGIAVDEPGLFNLDIVASTFQQNGALAGSAASAGGALSVAGVPATVRNSLFSGNFANSGGAIHGAVSLIENSTICGNSARSAGGGAALTWFEATVARNTFCNNTVTTMDPAQFGGGALAIQSADVTVVRNTFDGNVALRGAGIAFGGGDLTLSGNTLLAPATLPAGALGSLLRYSGTDAADGLQFFNNILIGQCSYAGPTIPDNALSNIEASGTTCRLLQAAFQSGNQTAVGGNAVNLAPLSGNGGPTETRLPQEPSIALDSGSNFTCTLLDQRGYRRNDPACDIGAVEVGGSPPPVAVFADSFE